MSNSSSHMVWSNKAMDLEDRAMNKIVLQHYPASKLPEELREGIAPGASVRITVEEENRRDPMTREELLQSFRDARARAKGVTLEEAVARVRELRDEWDD